MRKQIFLRGLLGIPIGISIGYLITVISSLGWGNGYYSPCVPELIERTGSEIGAVVLQTVLLALLGASLGAASVIWEMESWSIAKQTGVHLFILSIVIFPIAYINYWMKHSVIGVLSYVGIFLAIFFIIWMIQYCIWKRRVKEMTDKLNRGH